MTGPEVAPDPVQPDRIELRGLRVLGAHGALPEEQQRAQPFEVDLDLELDLRPAGQSDRLSDTVDYGSVTEAVAAVVAGPHVELLEHLAERLAVAALASGAPHATAVTVSVRKTRPPVPNDLRSAGVTIRRVIATPQDLETPTAADPSTRAGLATLPGSSTRRGTGSSTPSGTGGSTRSGAPPPSSPLAAGGTGGADPSAPSHRPTT
jgi:dihydroneopterin aldolase